MLSKEEADALRQKKKQRAQTTDHLCSCGQGKLIRRPARKKDPNGRTQYWYGCSRFPDCKATFFEVDGKPKRDQSRAADTS